MRLLRPGPAGALAIVIVGIVFGALGIATAQDQSAAAAAPPASAQAPEPLSDDEMEVLVARIALYPDELVALISGAALFPLQIVEAERFLEDYAKDKNLKPKESWDGSVISLLNYPEVVKMMSEDLEWTQAFGDAIAYQQKDVLIAIQQLRDEAVAKDIIKSDDKIKVVHDNDNIVIQPAAPEKIYVPQYPPEMLYEPNYVAAPITYYPDPYPPYYYPGAPFFAAAVTGLAWAAAVDWNDWGVWGGRWNDNIDLDCNNCFNNRNFNGKVNFNDIDWKNVDRSKLNIDRSQLNKFDRNNIRERVKADGDNAIRDRAANIRDRGGNGTLAGRASKVSDVRKSTLEGLKNRPGAGGERPNIGQGGNRPNIGQGGNRPNIGQGGDRPNIGQGGNRPNIDRPSINKPNRDRPNANRPSGRPKPGARPDNRPRQPGGLGNIDRGKMTQIQSNRGRQAMGGGARGGAHRQMSRPSGGGGRSMHRGGGGGGHARRGGGGGGRRR